MRIKYRTRAGSAYIDLHDDGGRTKRSTGIAVPSTCKLDPDTGRVTGRGSSVPDTALAGLRLRIERERLACMAEGRAFDRSVIDPRAIGKGELTFALAVQRYARTANVSDTSRRRYKSVSNAAKEWDQGHTPVAKVTYAHVADFERYLRDRPGSRKGSKLSVNTVGMYVGIAGAAFAELVRAGTIPGSPFSVYKTPKRKAPKHRVLNREQREAIESAELSGPAALWRDRLLFQMYTGLRVRDALSIRTEHLRYEGDGLRLRFKTPKQGVIIDQPLTKLFNGKPARLLAPYLAAEKERGDGLLWPEVSYMVARNRFPKVLEACGVDVVDFHSHILRHTFGTALAEAGVKREVIQVLIGHKSMQSTAIYSTVNQATADAAVDAAAW